MFKVAKYLSLGAVWWGACSFVDSSKLDPCFSERKEVVDSQPAYDFSVRELIGLEQDSYNRNKRDLDLIGLYLKSNSTGSDKVVDLNHLSNSGESQQLIYANPFNNAIGLKLGSISLEIPVNSKFMEMDTYGRSNFQGVRYEPENFWIVGNDSYDLDRYKSEEVPISALGGLLKKILWDTELVAPIRRIADKLSDLPDSPTKFVFGAGAKSDLDLKLSTDRISLSYGVKFNEGFKFGIEWQNALKNNKDRAIKIAFNGKF